MMGNRRHQPFGKGPDRNARRLKGHRMARDNQHAIRKIEVTITSSRQKAAEIEARRVRAIRMSNEKMERLRRKWALHEEFPLELREKVQRMDTNAFRLYYTRGLANRADILMKAVRELEQEIEDLRSE